MKIHYRPLWFCVLATAIGCQRTDSTDSADFGRFEGEVVAAWNDDGRHMTLREDFAYVDRQNRRWKAPTGTVVDGASIPAAFWTFIGGPFEGRYRNASVVHDVECVDMKASWQDVHTMFYEACRCGGVDETKAKMLYYAVYHFGPRWETVTETRVEMREDAEGKMVEHEVTEERVVRVDPPPPTPEEVAQVEALIEEENPDLSVIKKTNRDELRRRPRRSPGRTRTDDGSDIAASSLDGRDQIGQTSRRRPEGGPERNERGEKRVEDVDAETAIAARGERPQGENAQDSRSGERGQRPPRRQDASDLPAVTPEEQQLAVEQVRQFIEQQAGEPRLAEYEVERTRNGFRVIVRYLHLDKEGQPTGEEIGTSTVRLSLDGKVLEMTSGR
ncbi:MAG: DUF1353 domain-containing protein [Thermoguttaceae bacterium]|nr:DUF1353 domain-containing protein [Thermoguttaceae bacterium]